MIVVGCKLDLRDERSPVRLEDIMAPIMKEYREIETCIECSALTLIQVSSSSLCQIYLFLKIWILSFSKEGGKMPLQRLFSFFSRPLMSSTMH